LPLRLISPPFPCSNEIYEERLRVAIGATQSDGIEGVAFGDLFLAEVRQSRESQSRERMMEGSGINRFSPYGDAQQQNRRGR
jgi:hypothetical protein